MEETSMTYSTNPQLGFAQSSLSLSTAFFLLKTRAKITGASVVAPSGFLTQRVRLCVCVCVCLCVCVSLFLCSTKPKNGPPLHFGICCESVLNSKNRENICNKSFVAL